MKRSWFAELDALLRGEKTRALLETGEASAIRVRTCVGSALVLGAIYGLCMGFFAVMTRTPPSWEQWFCAAIKVPALFLCTLVVTFPSLYVFSALLGARLRFLDVLRVLLAAITVNLCVLAAFGPITGFFTISTTSYAFMKLLNVAFYAVSGFLGLGCLVRMMRGLEEKAGQSGRSETLSPVVPPALIEGRIVARTDSRSRANRVLAIWLVVYALVGAQMGWVLRPFIGDPNQPFQLFRARESNIFTDIAASLAELLR